MKRLWCHLFGHVYCIVWYRDGRAKPEAPDGLKCSRCGVPVRYVMTSGKGGGS